MSHSAFMQVAERYPLLQEPDLADLREQSADEMRAMLLEFNVAATGGNTEEAPATTGLIRDSYDPKLSGTEEWWIIGAPNMAHRPVLFRAMKGLVDECIDRSDSDYRRQDVAKIIGRGIIGIHAYNDGNGRTARGVDSLLNNHLDLVKYSLESGMRNVSHLMTVYTPETLNPFLNAYADRTSDIALEQEIGRLLDDQYGCYRDSIGHVERNRYQGLRDLQSLQTPQLADHIAYILPNYRTFALSIATALGEDFDGLRNLNNDDAWKIARADAKIKADFALYAMDGNIEADIDAWHQPGDEPGLYVCSLPAPLAF